MITTKKIKVYSSENERKNFEKAIREESIALVVSYLNQARDDLRELWDDANTRMVEGGDAYDDAKGYAARRRIYFETAKKIDAIKTIVEG